jgi:chemotaxis signal transduction protein
MSERAAPTGEELALMVVQTADFDVGVVAERVQEVVPIEKWSGEAALDLLQLVGAPSGEGAVRILVVRRDGREPLAALVSGAVALRHVARGELLELPAPLAAHARWVSHVVISDGRAPLLVLDTERLVS